MAVQGNKIKFVYVNGNSLPSSVDGDTIYFVKSTGLYVGSQLIADTSEGFDPAEINARLDALEDAQITVTVTGEGPDITGVTFTNNVLTITKGDQGYLLEEDLPEYSISKLSTPTTGSEATYQLTKDSTPVGVNIEVPSQVVYSVIESATPTTGYAKTYSLTADGVETGTKIDIPKDLVIESGEVKTVTTADDPYPGAVVGDKYIDLTLNDANEDHIYIPVKDLVDIYTAGTGISISANNEISVDTNTIATVTYVDDEIEAAALKWTVVQ